ncbi:MAG: hypothetical protein MR051_05990 [Lentisphaeria bacterium]|nr:hypothetical protein [Lentisphaeria bacterium]
MSETLFNISAFIVYPLIAVLLSMALTALCVRGLPKLGFIDKPGGRHIHKRAVPRGGGIAIALAVGFTMVAHIVSGRDEMGLELLKYTMIPAGMILVTGIVDDRFGLPSRVKLAVQIVAAILIWYGYGTDLTICGCVLPKYAAMGITVLWVVGVINAFNMVDGLDGLATGLAAISGVCLSIWFLSRRDPKALYMMIFVGACLGFLRYNFSPAKIFLGDTGSMFLGLFLAVAGGGTLDYTATFTSLLLPPLIIGVPLFDMVLAVWRRSVRKQLNPQASGLMDADSDHLHHRLLRDNHSHSRSALIMYVISMVFAGLAIMLLFFRDRASAIAFVLMLVTLLVMLRHLAVVELYDSMSFLRQLHFRRRLIFTAMHPLFDLMILCVAAALFDFLVYGTVSAEFVACAVTPVMLALILGRCYRVFWLRASMGDRGRLFLAAAIGGVLSVSLLYWRHAAGPMNPVAERHFAGAALLFVLMISLLLLFERSLLHYLEAAWYHVFVLEYQRRRVSDRVLLVGGGDRMRMCMIYFGSCRRSINMYDMIGVVDDDPQLAGRRAFDLPVLGTVGDLEEIYARTPFDRVLVTTAELPEEKRERIAAFCADRGISCGRMLFDGAGLRKGPAPGRTRTRIFTEKIPWLLIDFVCITAAALACSASVSRRMLPWYVLCMVLIPLIFMAAGGVYRVSWLRAGIGDRWRLLKWSLLGTIAAQSGFSLWRMFWCRDCGGEAELAVGALTFVALTAGGAQFFRLLLHPTVYYALSRRDRGTGGKVLVFGGGLLCRLYQQCLVEEMGNDKPFIVGIIDDDEALHGLRCNGLPVLGGVDDLPGICRNRKVDRIVLCVDRVSGVTLTRLHEFCAANGIGFSGFSVSERPMFRPSAPVPSE